MEKHKRWGRPDTSEYNQLFEKRELTDELYREMVDAIIRYDWLIKIACSWKQVSEFKFRQRFSRDYPEFYAERIKKQQYSLYKKYRGAMWI